MKRDGQSMAVVVTLDSIDYSILQANNQHLMNSDEAILKRISVPVEKLLLLGGVVARQSL
jgi:hypothetical protein